VHQYVVELINHTGRLVFLAFKSAEDKASFMSHLRTQIHEVAGLPDHALGTS